MAFLRACGLPTTLCRGFANRCCSRLSSALRLLSLDARTSGYAVDGRDTECLGTRPGLGVLDTRTGLGGSGSAAALSPVGCSRAGIGNPGGSELMYSNPGPMRPEIVFPLRMWDACVVVLVVGRPVPPCRCVWVSTGGRSRLTTGSTPEVLVVGFVIVLWW